MIKKCLYCGVPFKTRARDAKFHSKKCSFAHRNENPGLYIGGSKLVSTEPITRDIAVIIVDFIERRNMSAKQIAYEINRTDEIVEEFINTSKQNGDYDKILDYLINRKGYHESYYKKYKQVGNK